MSYDIIKSIKIKDKKVFVTCKPNNVHPGRYEEWQSDSLTKILNEEGQRALDITILKEYESGNFQSRGAKNKYTRALEILYTMPEYKAFDWRTRNVDDWGNRDSQDFKDLLGKAMNTKHDGNYYILSRINYRGERAYGKASKRYLKWLYGTKGITRFVTREQAQRLIDNLKDPSGIDIMIIDKKGIVKELKDPDPTPEPTKTEEVKPMTEQDIISKLFAINKELLEKIENLELTNKDCEEEIERLTKKNEDLDNENDRLMDENSELNGIQDELDDTRTELDDIQDKLQDIIWWSEARQIGIVKTEIDVIEKLKEVA